MLLESMAMAVSAQLVNLSAKAELKLVEAVATAMPSGQVRTPTRAVAVPTFLRRKHAYSSVGLVDRAQFFNL